MMPTRVVEWLDHYGFSIDSTKEILLASILPSVATLLGHTTVQVPSKLFPENVNVFCICLCEPGAGKSPAFQHGCQIPLRIHVEQRNDNRPLFVDDFTEKGLFNQLKASTGCKAIIGKEEVSQFFDRVLGTRETSIDVERIINLFDGAPWLYSKGDKSARQLVENPGISIAGFSQPERFFPIYRRLSSRKDGSLDRMFVYQPMPHRCLAAERQQHINAVQASSMRDFRIVYGFIYDCYHPEGEAPRLRLSANAVTVFENYTVSLLAQWPSVTSVTTGPVALVSLLAQWPSVTTGPVALLAQWPSGPVSLVSLLAQCHYWPSGPVSLVSLLAQCHYWPSGPVSLGSLLAQWPSVTTGPVSLLAQWPSVTSVTTGPVALLAQWHYWPSVTSVTTGPVTQCHYWPSGTTGPVALLAKWHYWPSVTSVTTGPVTQCHYWPSVTSVTTGPVAQYHYWPSDPVSLLAQCHYWHSSPVSLLAQCHYWTSDPVSLLDQCHYRSSVITGPGVPVTQILVP
ncbi:hypothetical protein QZH41_000262 [Actinostola sp. cb2023]|nr:hypothetical protein QZH41_000262 [Actinostola sp. cb2023]